MREPGFLDNIFRHVCRTIIDQATIYEQDDIHIIGHYAHYSAEHVLLVAFKTCFFW